MKKFFEIFLFSIVSLEILNGCVDKNAQVIPINTKTRPEGIVKTYEEHNESGLRLNAIVSEMADQLIKYKVDRHNDKDLLAISTFVDVHSYKTHNELGRVIAEDFIHEMHRRGENVLDFHLTGYVEVTPSGDILLSRDAEELARKASVSRFLIGTIAKNDGGYVINARIVSLKNNYVESTAIGFIPNKLFPTKVNPPVVVKSPKQNTLRGGLIYREDPNLTIYKNSSKTK